MTKKRRKVVLKCNDKHLTKQDHGGTADINHIAQQYMSGRLPYPENPPQFYGDISAVDVNQARNVLAEVHSHFDGLPSDIRSHFANRPEAYVDFLDDQADEIAEKGLQSVLWDAVHGENDSNDSADAEQIAQTAQETPATPAEGGTE